MSELPSPARRAFVVAALGAGGAVLFYRASARTASTGRERGQAISLNGWIRISPDGSVGVLSRATELGQGALTSLALIVAEELRLDSSAVAVEMAPVTEEFMDHGNTLGYGVGAAYYATWGSLSSRDMDTGMRKIAATARVLLQRAAARQWQAKEADCIVQGGTVRHADGRSASYGQLAPTAATLPVPQDVEPTPRAEWRRLGQPTARSDIPAKVDGSAVYGVDVRLPDLLVATIAQCPMFGGRLDSVDTGGVEHMPGVVKVVKLDDAVAVVGTGYWPAKRGLERLRPSWRAGERHAGDSSEQSERLRQGAHAASHLYLPNGITREQVSAAHEAGLARASLHLEALYEVPFLAHAPMEPMNATAKVSAHGAELWVPTQYQSMVRDVTAEILHVPKDRVIVHTTAVGGGFGRRTEVDYAIQAVLIARDVQRPVKLIWSREEDMSRGFFRPAAAMLLKGALDAKGDPAAFSFAAACPSIMDYSIERRNGAPRAEIEEAGLATARDWPYAVPAQKIALASVDLGVPVTWMRSVGSAASVFALESFIDEMAAAAQKDPVAYRRHLLSDRPRELAVVERAASLAGWDRSPAAGRHRGFALSCTNGSVVAQVIEIEVLAERALRLHSVHCVVDCGAAMNPSTVIAQMEGGIIFGLTGALFGDISLKGGAVEQKNFDRYPLLTLAQTPVIHVSILDSDAPIGGVGEESVPPVAPALANALFAATGERLRRLPLARAGFSVAS